MSIRIIDEKPDIYLTQSEHDRLMREWRQACMFMVNPPNFEEYVRSHRKPVGIRPAGGEQE